MNSLGATTTTSELRRQVENICLEFLSLGIGLLVAGKGLIREAYGGAI